MLDFQCSRHDGTTPYNSGFVMCQLWQSIKADWAAHRSFVLLYHCYLQGAIESPPQTQLYTARVKTRPPNTCSSCCIIVIVCTILLLSSSGGGFYAPLLCLCRRHRRRRRRRRDTQLGGNSIKRILEFDEKKATLRRRFLVLTRHRGRPNQPWVATIIPTRHHVLL